MEFIEGEYEHNTVAKAVDIGTEWNLKKCGYSMKLSGAPLI